MHLTGRTNFATVRRDLANKGESTEKMNVYVKTKSKEGAPIDTDVVLAMEEYSRRIDEVPEPERTTEIQDRIFHDLIGPDGHGYVRTYGVGVNRSRATGASSSSSQISGGINLDELRHQIRNEVRDELREEIQQEIGDKIRAEIRSQLATLRSPDDSGGVNVRQVPDASSAHRALRESLGDVDIQLQNDSLMPLSHQPTTELPVARTDCEPFQTNIEVGDKVELMSIDIPKQKVAEGILVCVDPSGEVEGRILGPNFFKIYVDKVIRPDTYLPRPLRKKLTVGQIVGNSVAWPSMDVLRKEK